MLGTLGRTYIQHCLNTDLRHITAAYGAGAGARFWVAEVDGCVVGTVGVRPVALVLKRMSVRRGYRGQGIGTALARTALAFAAQRGCKAVVLNTLMVQHEARALYERLGFRRHRQYVLPTVYGYLANCTITMYRYELDGSEGNGPALGGGDWGTPTWTQ
uniref:Uncharacterized protein n=1 Tax=Melopsittacus undulatus TaxID=13146 RepID=A0A8V5GAH4_MELUD